MVPQAFLGAFAGNPSSGDSSVRRRDECGRHLDQWATGRPFFGGYLPYVVDATPFVRPGQTNLVAVRLDNHDNPITGPKPLRELDFNLYGGLYRPASLRFKDTLHITDPILADQPAGGGIFVTFPEVTDTIAVVRVQTHVRNAGWRARAFALRLRLRDPTGREVARRIVRASLEAGEATHLWAELGVKQPRLWSPATPYLYRLTAELLEDSRVVDMHEERIGIRRIRITPEGFWLNGRKMFLRGVNRHQEYPWIGNALSDAAQRRDARKIKEAGFDYVRLSHYPQSPAFLDACDETGLLVMNCLMGWQYFNPDPRFVEQKLREIRAMIRRDRNHPSVVLWEVSLNESEQPAWFIEQAQTVARQEYPGDQMYTAGWQPGFDVFLQARQHGGCKGVTNVPCVISEYGDWEYYAQDAGLQQHLWLNLEPAERSSRQRRADGETRLLQQALNFQEAHNDNLQTSAFADGLWVMFDYNRGYAPDIEASGCMDLFRLPKFGFWFYRSQRDPEELVLGQPLGPMVHIASYHTAASPRSVRVFSNCDEVELWRNGVSLGRRSPDRDRVSTHLRHPPFTFELPGYETGTLVAVAYRNGRAVASHQVHTPGPPERLAVWFDLAGIPFANEGKDAIFVHAELRDARDTLVPTNGHPIALGAIGTVSLIGEPDLPTEAGGATRLLQAEHARPSAVVVALTTIREQDRVRVLVASGSPNGTPVPRMVIRYTLDGTRPTQESPRYRRPVQSTPDQTLRVGLFVGRDLVLEYPPMRIQTGP